MPQPAGNLPQFTWLSTLSDLARVRMLRLLEREELSVGELARALQFPQSTLSRQLKILHDAGWITKRPEGTASIYRLSPDAVNPSAWQFWDLTRSQLGTQPVFEHDDHRLAKVLADRNTDSKAFFGRVAGAWDEVRRDLFGDAFTAEALLSLVQPDWVVADIGCGTGNASEHLAPLVRKVIAIDREPAMLEAARKRLSSFRNVEFRQGDVSSLPIKSGDLDAAIVFLVLHHIDDPAAAVSEVARTLVPGGVLMIVDMVSHDRDSYRNTMGHKHLGFDEKQVRAWARTANLIGPRFRMLRPDTARKGPALFVATMSKPR